MRKVLAQIADGGEVSDLTVPGLTPSFHPFD